MHQSSSKLWPSIVPILFGGQLFGIMPLGPPLIINRCLGAFLKFYSILFQFIMLAVNGRWIQVLFFIDQHPIGWDGITFAKVQNITTIIIRIAGKIKMKWNHLAVKQYFLPIKVILRKEISMIHFSFKSFLKAGSFFCAWHILAQYRKSATTRLTTTPARVSYNVFWPDRFHACTGDIQ